MTPLKKVLVAAGVLAASVFAAQSGAEAKTYVDIHFGAPYWYGAPGYHYGVPGYHYGAPGYYGPHGPRYGYWRHHRRHHGHPYAHWRRPLPPYYHAPYGHGPRHHRHGW